MTTDTTTDYATRGDIERLEGSIHQLEGYVHRMEERLEAKLDRLDNRLWMFMGTILVFTLGIVLKEAI